MTILKHSLETTGKVAVPGGDIAYRLYKPHNARAAAQTPLIVLHGGPGGCHASMYDCLNSLATIGRFFSTTSWDRIIRPRLTFRPKIW